MDKNSEITALKILLRDSDYKALKHADGALSDEEYRPIKEQRAAWRTRINELELLSAEEEAAEE